MNKDLKKLYGGINKDNIKVVMLIKINLVLCAFRVNNNIYDNNNKNTNNNNNNNNNNNSNKNNSNTHNNSNTNKNDVNNKSNE